MFRPNQRRAPSPRAGRSVPFPEAWFSRASVWWQRSRAERCGARHPLFLSSGSLGEDQFSGSDVVSVHPLRTFLFSST